LWTRPLLAPGPSLSIPGKRLRVREGVSPGGYARGYIDLEGIAPHRSMQVQAA